MVKGLYYIYLIYNIIHQATYVLAAIPKTNVLMWLMKYPRNFLQRCVTRLSLLV